MAEQAARSRILIVEDDGDARETLAFLLRNEGYEVAGARHGGDALDAIAAGPRPDLILLDLTMPVVDGWEFRRLQLQDPALEGIPVVVLSARPSAGDPAFAGVPVLLKPIAFAQLLETVRQELDGET